MPNIYGGKAISNKGVLSFFTKGGDSFRRLNCNSELIPDYWHTYRESLSANTEHSFMNKKLFGNG